MANLVGQSISQYHLDSVIGEGAQATVYKAHQSSLNRRVAVKVLNAGYEQVLARFKREARTIALLRHRNILVVYEYGEDNGHAYIVMEHVSGGTLRDHLDGKPMAWTQVIKLAVPIAEALHYAHGQGLIHRDVKPSNILMPQADWPLLADFGLVKVKTRDGSSAITNVGAILGTPAYIAPEQANGDTVDYRADMYSLGVILFEMMTGRLPFQYKNANRMLVAQVMEQPPSPYELNSKCPPKLDQVILRALRKSPDERFSDMKVMAKALRAVIGEGTRPMTSADLKSADRSTQATSALPIFAADDTPAKPKPKPAKSDGPTVVLQDHNVSFDLDKPGGERIIVGRTYSKGNADIDLGPYGGANAGISRRHACFLQQGNNWVVEDMGSLNGSYVNGSKLTPNTPVALKHGDIIRCSHLSFVFLMPTQNS